MSYFFLGLHSEKLSHWYNSRANQLKKRDLLEQENRELCEEMTTLRDEYERLTSMMEASAATQNQPTHPPPTPLQRIMISEIVSMLVFMAPVSAPHHHMPSGFPSGMPPNFFLRGTNLKFQWLNL